MSGVWAFGGGVAPLARMPGGNLYIENQGTQGFMYTPGQTIESYSFRIPTTGQAWSGAVGTLGPQLSIGLIQGANQTGTPLVLPGAPRQTSPPSEVQSPLIESSPRSLLDEIPQQRSGRLRLRPRSILYSSVSASVVREAVGSPLSLGVTPIIHPFVQSTVLIHSANVVSGIPNCCFNA